jgi:hypothetical protein
VQASSDPYRACFTYILDMFTGGFPFTMYPVTSVPAPLSLQAPLNGKDTRTSGGWSRHWWSRSFLSGLRQAVSSARSCYHANSWLHLVPPSTDTHFSAGPDQPPFQPSIVGSVVLAPAAWMPRSWSCIPGVYLIPNLRHRKGSTGG